MHRSCVVCVLVADFDVEEIMEEFMIRVSNYEVREFYKDKRPNPPITNAYMEAGYGQKKVDILVSHIYVRREEKI